MTLRNCSANVRERLLARVSRSCLVIAQCSRCEAEVSVLRATYASLVFVFRGAILVFLGRVSGVF